MRNFLLLAFFLALSACSGATEESSVADTETDTTGTTSGDNAGTQAGDSGEDTGDTTDTTDETTDSGEDDTRLPTDATWPDSAEGYDSTHLSLITSLELSEEQSGNQFGALLRLIAGQAGVEVTGYFDEALATGELVSLVDHWGIEASAEPQAFLMSHLNGTWAEGATWDAILAGSGSVTVDPSSFAEGSGTPSGAYEYAALVDGNLSGENGFVSLQMPPGNILSGIIVNESQLVASDVDVSSDTVGYSGTLTGWVAISEWYEGLNRAFESMCGCAGFEEGQDLWSESSPGVYTCDASLFTPADCTGTENEAICTGGIPLCSTLVFMISGDLDKDPDIPGNDAMSVILEIETTPVTCSGLTAEEAAD